MAQQTSTGPKSTPDHPTATTPAANEKSKIHGLTTSIPPSSPRSDGAVEHLRQQEGRENRGEVVAEEVEREAGEEEDDECDRLADDVTEDRRRERARFVAVVQHCFPEEECWP